MKQKLLSMFFVCLMLAGAAFAQDKRVTGKVTSKEDGLPLPGVSVKATGSNVVTQTDANGNYSIGVPATAKSLEFSFIGFLSQNVAIGSKTAINISLVTDAKQLSEIVVTAYGTQRRADVTGAQSSIKAADIANTPILSPEQALQGRAAGVQVTQSSGTPGGGISIRIRGTSSIGASSQPLYVVDGVPISTGSYTQIGAGGQTSNALSDINPNDIESIEVLKDAASSAIYGSRAANGVVIVNTKRGANQTTKISFNSYYGQQEVNKLLPLISGQQYIELMNEAVLNRRGPGNNYGTLTGLSADPATYANTDWQNEIFRTAPIKNYDLSARGGNDKTKFSISGSYFDQEGIVIASGFKRWSGRINVDNQATEKLKLSLNAGFNSSVSNRINNDNNINGVVSASILLGSHIPVYNANGTYGKDAVSSVDNPVASALERIFLNTNNRLLTSGSAEYQILPSLTFKSQLSLDYLTSKDRNYNPTTTNTGAASAGAGSEGQNQEVNYVTENILNFNKTFASKHILNLTGVFSYQESNYENLFAAATGFPTNDFTRLSSGAVRVTTASGGSSYALESYVARANYSFNNKYVLQGSVRVDGSSRFGADKRYGTFPAVSAAWNVTEESFLKNVNEISNLKLRGSYGIVGNQEIGNFTSLQLVGGGANYLQQSGLAPSQLGNTILSWENTASIDLGFDLGMFKNRLTFTFDAYQKKTEDLLLGQPLVGSSGFLSIQSNIGKLENKGLEFGLTGVILDKKDFSWTSNVNLSFNKNEVLAISGNPFASGFASWVAPGGSLGDFRGYRTDGIFQSAAEIAAAPIHTVTASALTSTAPGDQRFKDLNGDGRITADDQEIIGNGMPTYFGGFTNNFRYKNFDLSAFVQFSGGNQIYNNTRGFSEGMNSIFGQTTAVLNRWTPTNPSTTMPRAVYQDPNNNRRTSDRFLEDGDFLRMKNISLSYTFSPQFLTKLKVSNLKLYVAGQNLFTITDYSGLDPEVSTFSDTNTAPGTDFLTFPQSKTYTFGLNLTF
ncbi:SusC/RagA family TonB-linked outer membrane protein [Pedobacter cryophilus]|uniref:TonB-dependent receptor n=1 Tax=Pedobacter cryophilus TaxID=2571271 RepID=A0A4U1BXN2_9SPHI|nr:TonB-dependent receptor [Pedobacter cryophilus]TKB97792.1 TonB-dependent receptor [Pedobacter cryophilus]